MLGFLLRQIAFTTQLAGVEEGSRSPTTAQTPADKVAFQEFEQEGEGVGKDRINRAVRTSQVLPRNGDCCGQPEVGNHWRELRAHEQGRTARQ